jgi:hypothetical protein
MNFIGKLILGCSLLLVTQVSQASIIYTNDFETSVGSEWSATTLDVTPIGSRNFLGQFVNDVVSLSLAEIDSHNTITVSFDLFVINSWDGNQQNSFDYFNFDILNGSNLLSTTFSNTEEYGHNQGYSPDNSNGDFAAHTGASEVDSLGYSFYGDSVYNFSFTFAHTASNIQLNFSASGLQSMDDESWGIDNVSVQSSTVKNIPEPSTLLLFAFTSIFLVRKFR